MSQPCLYLHVFRVEEGLGNACLLEFPDKSLGVLDWGTQAAEALQKFVTLASGRRVRFVAATHAHADHTLGLERLLKRCEKEGIEIEKFFYPASTLFGEHFHLTRARNEADRLKIWSTAIGEDTMLTPPGERQPPCLAWAEDGAWDLRVLGPPLPVISHAETKSSTKGIVPGNETSLVVLFRFAGAPGNDGVGRALLAGDATPRGLSYAQEIANRYGYRMENQAFLIPHHGSEHNFPAWLKQHTRGIAIISGSATSPHHPSHQVLQQLAEWTGNEAPKLFCTSYSQCCARKFGGLATTEEAHLVQPGDCFGDIVVSVPRDSAAVLQGSSSDGHGRRRFGYCGNKSVPRSAKASAGRKK